MKKRCLAAILTAVLVFMLNTLSAFALTADNGKTAAQLVQELIGSGITSSNISSTGTVYSISDAYAELGMLAGVALDTSGVYTAAQDADLAGLISAAGKTYGVESGLTHTSTLQFTMTATGTLLNFKYAFASSEFTEAAQYNDIFGLFISVNGGAFENIALLDNGEQITITNLRAGQDGTQYNSGADGIGATAVGTKLDYFTVANQSMPNADTANGVSNVFTAQKAVAVGDTVTVKFAIADVGDVSYNSYVLIQAGSLSFGAPVSNVNYTDEKLAGLDASHEYAITENSTTYRLNSDVNGKIPLSGTDLDGKSYQFIGKTISIVRKGGAGETDSAPQGLTVAPRPAAPSLGAGSVAATDNSITITSQAGAEYSIDAGATWHAPDAAGKVSFTGLTKGAQVTVLARTAATSSAPASLASAGTTVTVQAGTPSGASAPTIITPVQNQTITALAGSAAAMSVTASNAVNYQWQINRNDGSGWVNIPGAGGASYAASGVTTAHNGYQYRCLVANAYGSVPSFVFTLNVINAAVQEEVPDTGDAAQPELWLGIILLSVAGLGLRLALAKRRRGM